MVCGPFTVNASAGRNATGNCDARPVAILREVATSDAACKLRVVVFLFVDT